ncbi:Fic family protein [Pandoraea pulmonicola]|uniref:Fido domain-containing protein n=1 Tax=Pandoraea pulmonicola TaxID=93221 RepID=A0AAJ4ZDI5_PANPU|nr:Fic family protein [Pandoraea pulmonicola]AJC20284.1 hypothetical protein RO07_07015 [Pandoraea pulmonicola]SUA91362.1 Uncharacterised protein [Pandoraea pulmonicola]
MHAQMRAAIDASPRTQAVAQQRKIIAAPPAPQLQRPVAPTSSAPIQRVVDFASDVDKQYTKDAYLTKLKQASGKSFAHVRLTWMAAERSPNNVRLSNNIALAWEQLAPYAPPDDSQANTLGTSPENDAGLLDSAARDIPMLSRYSVDNHRKAIAKHYRTIFPFAREESPEAQAPWNPDEAVDFAGRLATIDHTTWDNLTDEQRATLGTHRNNLGELTKILERLVSSGASGKDDYVIALYSHLAARRGDGQSVGKEAGLGDKGRYLQTIVDVRSGKSPRVEAYSPPKYSDVSAVDWTSHRELIEDRPFLRQRTEQLHKRLGGNDKRNERDILTKWASPATSMQRDNVGMDQETVTKSKVSRKRSTPGANISLLDTTLAQIAPIEGTLYAAYARNDSLKVGEVFSQGTPLSASESAGGTVTFSKGAVADSSNAMDRYKIYAKGFNGIPISPVAPQVGHGQREVVFRARATFKVLSIEEGNFGAGVTRLVTLLEQGESSSHVNAVKHSQEALLNPKDRWLTGLPQSGLDQRTQAWFISNSVGGTVEGQSDASFAYPYGKRTAEVWHEVITDDGTDIWSIDGFKSIAARLTGGTAKDIDFITQADTPSTWGEPVKLDKRAHKALVDNGMTVSKETRKPGEYRVAYQKEDKQPLLKAILRDGATQLKRIMGTPSPDNEARVAALAAEIQQRLSVLHPLHDGNGRISRAYAYLILRRAGFGIQPDQPQQPLRVFDQDADQTTPAREWKASFARPPSALPSPLSNRDMSLASMPINETEDVDRFVSGLAGGKMDERLTGVREEEDRLATGGRIERDDMWVVEELLAYIPHREAWLSDELVQEMNRFVQAHGAMRRGTVSRQAYADAVALKRRLEIEIVQRLSAGLDPQHDGDPTSVPAATDNTTAMVVEPVAQDEDDAQDTMDVVPSSDDHSMLVEPQPQPQPVVPRARRINRRTQRFLESADLIVPPLPRPAKVAALEKMRGGSTGGARSARTPRKSSGTRKPKRTSWAERKKTSGGRKKKIR